MRPKLRCLKKLLLAIATVFYGNVGCVDVDKDLGGHSSPPPVGIATFAILSENFKCDSFIAATRHIPEIHLAVLMQSFGQNMGCLGLVSMTGRLKSVQFHLVNEVCIRNDNCFESREIFSGTPQEYEQLVLDGEGWLIQRIHKQARLVTEAVDYLQIDNCYVSPGLESNLPPEVMDVLISRVKPLLPKKCLIVFNPVDDVGPASLADLYEHHAGEFPATTPECIANNDGTHILVGNSVNYPRNMSLDRAKSMLDRSNSCRLRFLWSASYSNCIGLSREFVYPHNRDCPDWRLAQPLIGLIK